MYACAEAARRGMAHSDPQAARARREFAIGIILWLI